MKEKIEKLNELAEDIASDLLSESKDYTEALTKLATLNLEDHTMWFIHDIIRLRMVQEKPTAISRLIID